MVKTKKKVGSFGSRYGRTIRKLYQEITEKARDTYECPNCSRKSVTREGTSIWKCKKCNSKFAGGAYQFTTGASKAIKQALEKAKRESE